MVLLTAVSINLASSGRFNEYWSIIAVERIAATGLTMPLPEMSGADPSSHQLNNPRFKDLSMPTVNRLIYPVDPAFSVRNTAQTCAG